MATRKSYTKRFKRNIISLINTTDINGKKRSKRMLEIEYGLGHGTLSKWETCLKHDPNNTINFTSRRNGDGLGRNVLSKDLDEQLYQWVIFRINKGLYIKEKFLKMAAIRIANDIGLDKFKASPGYLSNFKARYGLVYRSRTTCKKLPENARELALTFLKDVNGIIVKITLNLKMYSI